MTRRAWSRAFRRRWGLSWRDRAASHDITLDDLKKQASRRIPPASRARAPADAMTPPTNQHLNRAGGARSRLAIAQQGSPVATPPTTPTSLWRCSRNSSILGVQASNPTRVQFVQAGPWGSKWAVRVALATETSAHGTGIRGQKNGAKIGVNDSDMDRRLHLAATP